MTRRRNSFTRASYLGSTCKIVNSFAIQLRALQHVNFNKEKMSLAMGEWANMFCRPLHIQMSLFSQYSSTSLHVLLTSRFSPILSHRPIHSLPSMPRSAVPLPSQSASCPATLAAACLRQLHCVAADRGPPSAKAPPIPRRLLPMWTLLAASTAVG